MSSPKKILSFDVGIKNLAYCYLEEVMDENKSYKIIDWNIIDISTMNTKKNENIVECNCFLGKRKEKKCTKPAKYISKNENYYCEIHAKSQKEYIIPKKCHEISWLKKQKMVDLMSIAKTIPIDFYITETKAQIINKIYNYYQENLLQPIEKNTTNSKNIDLITIGRNMANKLDDFFRSFPIPTHVIIENQISTIASRMKTIQGELTMYFIAKCPEAHIEYISSKNKLKEFATKTETNENAAKVYSSHKKDAIEYTKQLLVDQTWMDHFMNEKKKDDLADCFLQGIWYLRI